MIENQKSLFNQLKKQFACTYDRSGSIGRRYARADEHGIPYCITVDFDTAQEKSITIRNREDTKQIRVKIKDLSETLQKLLSHEIEFSAAGKHI